MDPDQKTALQIAGVMKAPLQWGVSEVQQALQAFLKPRQTTYASPLAQNQHPVQQAVQMLQPTPTDQPQQTPSAVDGYVMNTPDQYLAPISSASAKYNVPSSILSSLLSRESMGFNPDVISGKINSPVGAQGIAQFMPDTAKGMGIDPFNTDQAIMGAAKKLRANLDQFKSLPLAIAAYNAGSGAVQQYNGIPPYKETQDYVTAVLNGAKTLYNPNMGKKK